MQKGWARLARGADARVRASPGHSGDTDWRRELRTAKLGAGWELGALQAPRAVGWAGGLQQRFGSVCVGHIAAGAGGRRGAARGGVLHAV